MKNINNNLIIKNTSFNLLGYGIPLIIAIVIIPFLIKGLGEEKFGILNLCLVIVGYFSFLDFGIGRALTKIIAEKIALNKSAHIPEYFWTSLTLMFFVSILVTIIIIFLTPFLVNSVFNISTKLHKETINTFYVLAISIPIVSTTAGLRGVLEAYQKFGTINIIRTALGISTFLMPFLCLIFTQSLFWIVIVLGLIRLIVWFQYLVQCYNVNSEIRTNSLKFNFSLIKPLFRLSSWLTVSNLVGPLIIHSDRFLIGVLISATAITYYGTPYEVVTKLLLIPGALTSVLFPAFSANYKLNENSNIKLFSRSIRFIFIFLYPIVFFLVTFAHESISMWLGNSFAEKSTIVLQLLSIGVLLNSLAYIPFTFLQGIGKPEIPAIINLIELPIYLFFMIIMIGEYGIFGAAFVWCFRVFLDLVVLYYFTMRVFSTSFVIKPTHIFIAIAVICLLLPLFLHGLIIKLTYSGIVISVFISLAWQYVLDIEEKDFLKKKLKFY
ncbi:MAG: flippase [Ignavibacteria bacterium]|nr:flippase [Ignavibacteria bacterium]